MKHLLSFCILLLCLATNVVAGNADNPITAVRKINPTTVEIVYSKGQCLTVDFYSDHIFRLFRDDSGGIIRPPKASPEASILVNNPRSAVKGLTAEDKNGHVIVSTPTVQLSFDKASTLLQVIDLRSHRLVMEEMAPVAMNDSVTMTLREQPDEYFYGGGLQNGRFSHKGKRIAIENQNDWEDKGVASPTPFYWSTKGYGLMAYTFGRGMYDFGKSAKGKVVLTHHTSYLDVFVMVDSSPAALLSDYYSLTGRPVLLPKFAFYEGHLNAYNRDYWKENQKGILFEDGKRYKESQKDSTGIKESLNGEKNNYQFSARAVVDRYKLNDMPLGWILPNDGYGAGYGQTNTLDGNIANLKSFGDYARKNGVEIGLWTQSDLHPKAGVSALLQRDIVKEVRDAGVRVLKTDVAWVGDGYSFGLNGVSDVAQVMPYYGNDARPFIITLDGWAGTQRYAAVWTGDQKGGLWENIRFHIPTYIGAGLSGLTNVASDLDGIFWGRDRFVNTRDFQWKTFTAMELNMDGWGSKEKYPQAHGEPMASINRMYLKLKSQLLPYTYSVAHAAMDSLPLVRAMFLQFPNDYTYGDSTRYQFMYGPSFLVAPIYQATRIDSLGNDIRNGIYLPEGRWIDYFSGKVYDGGRILNGYDAPVWKLPVFVKAGAILPMNNANNNVSEIDRHLRIFEFYPYGKSTFSVYDDDGTTTAYLSGESTSTLVESAAAKGIVTLIVHPTKGKYNGFVSDQSTEFRINVSAAPRRITAFVNGKQLVLRRVTSMKEYTAGDNVCLYLPAPEMNVFATPGSDFAKVSIKKTPQLWVKTSRMDVTTHQIVVKMFE
jgi:alpha-glucosidase (family GH31 glycosyl hydrolase)